MEPRVLFSSDILATGGEVGGAPDGVPPIAAEVTVSGSQWSDQFSLSLKDANLGVDGVSLTAQKGQTSVLPWVNVDRVRIRFSEAVNIGSEHLTMTSSSAASDVAVAEEFDYDNQTFTATWRFAHPLTAGRWNLNLSGVVTDQSTNPITGALFWRVNCLPGDATRDGRVDGSDSFQVRNRLRGMRFGAESLRSLVYNDVNGDGRISVSDLSEIRQRHLSELPSGVRRIVLVNADSGADIAAMWDGHIVDFATMPTRNLNVRVEVDGAVTGVQFDVSGNDTSRVDRTAPYSAFGDDAGHYVAWSPAKGPYTLTATPLLENDIAGVPLTIHFSTKGVSPPLPLIWEDFTSGAAGMAPVSGAWDVIGDAYAVSIPDTARTTHLNNLAMHSTALSGDFQLEVDAWTAATSGMWDDFAVVFSYQDSANYYFASFNEGNDAATSGIFRVNGGESTEVADIPTRVTPGTTYRVRVDRVGNRITVSLDGVPVASSDAPDSPDGLVGFASKNDRVSFDNLSVTGTPTPQPTSPPAAPSGLSAVASSSSSVSLTWSDNSGDESGFKVERSVDGVNFAQVAAVGRGVTGYTATGLSPETAYHFRVRAYNAAGDSAYSNPASAVTPAAPVAGGRPGPDNTGPTNPGVLVTKSGWTVTQDGAVIEDVHITGSLVIRANNVTLRNFRIDAAGDAYGIECNAGTGGLVVEDGEIYNMNSAAVYGYGVTLRRLDVHDSGGDGLKPNGPDFVLEDSWVRRLGKNDGSHADGVQARNSSDDRDFTGLVIRRNFFDMPKGLSGYRSNACIYLQDESENAGRILNAVIQDNWLNGGNYTLDIRGSQQEGHVITGNRFGRDYQYGVVYGASEAAVWSNNVWDDNGGVVDWL